VETYCVRVGFERELAKEVDLGREMKKHFGDWLSCMELWGWVVARPISEGSKEEG
jgi:hypothetical protein